MWKRGTSARTVCKCSRTSSPTLDQSTLSATPSASCRHSARVPRGIAKSKACWTAWCPAARCGARPGCVQTWTKRLAESKAEVRSDEFAACRASGPSKRARSSCSSLYSSFQERRGCSPQNSLCAFQPARWHCSEQKATVLQRPHCRRPGKEASAPRLRRCEAASQRRSSRPWNCNRTSNRPSLARLSNTLPCKPKYAAPAPLSKATRSPVFASRFPLRQSWQTPGPGNSRPSCSKSRTDPRARQREQRQLPPQCAFILSSFSTGSAKTWW
mmetsp:Transcript_150056/g.482299  ORF Transcript_150056/g.482299 Transcript_150056/m.482299 type:complete len:271 (+) Transcript_150056:586-1398(+)